MPGTPRLIRGRDKKGLQLTVLLQPMADPHKLSRFVEAQNPIFEIVLDELRAGTKRSHWMWFVFPQIAGLGSSGMAAQYAIGSLAEAEAYLRHAVLGPRLSTCTKLVNAVEGRSALTIFGRPDDLKFRSSMSLFARAAPDYNLFSDALSKYFGGEMDIQTVRRLP